MLTLARRSLCVLGLIITLCLHTACERPLPPGSAQDAATLPGDADAAQVDSLPPAVLMVRDLEPGTDLATGSEKTVDTAEGIVKVRKTDEGAIIDEYDGKEYLR